MTVSTKTKACTRCKIEKLLEEFHRQASTRDGRRFRCKECSSIYQKSDERRTFARERARKPENRAAAARYYRTEHGRRIQRESAARRRRLDAKKCKARLSITNAVAVGYIPRISQLCCYKCGKQAVNYHHRLGYEGHELDAVPMCRLCHAAAHSGG